MPYLGLIEERTGRELQSGEETGYHRIDLSRISFGLTERHPGDRQHIDFCVVNREPVKFPEAKSEWGSVHIVFFRDLESPIPAFTFSGCYYVGVGSSLITPSGQLITKAGYIKPA